MTELTVQPTVGVRPAPAPEPADPAGRRYAGLDGLRAIAVVTVLVYHLFPGMLPGGFIGVDVFFVLSGFLITSLLLRERAATGRIDLRGFWTRRARRLVPAIALLVVVCSAAALAVGGDVLVGLPRQLLGASTFSANWLSIAADDSYFGRGAPELFRNLWSLAVEEQFYVVWPLALLAIALVRRWGVRLAIVLGIAAASAVEMAVLTVPGSDPTRVYFGSDTHSFGLAVGAALALLLTRLRPADPDAAESAAQVFVRRWLPPLGVAGVLALIVAAYGMRDDDPFTYRGGLLLVSLATAAAVAAAVVPGSALGRLLDAGPLRAVGVRSYGLYLWHWPVFLLVVAALPDGGEPEAAAVVGLGALACSVAAALLSYRYLEQPIRRHGFRGAGRRAVAWMRGSAGARIAGAAGVAATGILIAATVAALVTAPATTSAQRLIEQGAAALATAPHPDATAGPRVPPDPHPVAQGPDISAFGDSVMLASAPALQQTFPGIAIDAVVSRQASTAPDLVAAAAAAGTLRPVVVVGLGTNGSVSAETLERVLSGIGPARGLVLVTAQAPRSWTDGVNQTLTAFAAEHPTRVAVADWRSAIAGHLDLLADDHIHPGMRGGLVYAGALESALRELAQHSTARVANPWDRAGPRPQ